MHNFNFHRPLSVDEAVNRLGVAPEGVALAGGMTLIPTLKQRLAAPTDLVDLSGVSDLRGISEEGNSIVIGAMTTHAEVAASALVKAKIPALAALAESIGDAQVRNRGTIGGSVANSDPAADYPAGLVGLGATVVTNTREVAADDFFTGQFETALEPAELVTAVKFPVPEKAGYAKFPNPASRYAIVGVFVSQGSAGTRVAVTGAGSSVFRVAQFEGALAGNFSPSAVTDGAVAADDLNQDIHGSAEYRAHLIGVMARRAVAAANG